MADKPKPPSLEPQHHRYIQLRLLGYTNPEAATELHIDAATAWRWGQMPQVSEELSKLQGDATESVARLLRNAGIKAAKTQTELLDCEDPRVRLQASIEILKRQPAVDDGASSKPADGENVYAKLGAWAESRTDSTEE